MSHLVRMEIITASSKVPSLIKRLAQVGAVGVTTFQALGCGIQKGTFEYEVEENKEVQLLPKTLLLVICEEEQVRDLVEAAKVELYTGHIGDGKILLSHIDNVVRVRTGEEGSAAIQRSQLE
ncbi:MAG: P-II family nitrogen regulator [Selenomonas sp.]|nr:P-II family nitrogen regulator [Selenomonas sp.]MCI7330039.1 P-II family nitrogen regulator [Selenomonadaceae bacterium]MDD6119473.1 P-II family nitrogen regulator [Selenomonadaceae bacterium]MDD7055574.1 P-II family nitrogen regulator [Selenomonadaceae bacterium]MDY3915877.1 P-II family nitrogen regulator [Selenomonadaceae bacterium]